MSAAIRKGAWGLVGFAMFALAGCGDDETTDPATRIDSTDPTTQYRIGQDRPYEELLVRDLGAKESAAIRQLGAPHIDPLPARESVRPAGAGHPQSGR